MFKCYKKENFAKMRKTKCLFIVLIVTCFCFCKTSDLHTPKAIKKLREKRARELNKQLLENISAINVHYNNTKRNIIPLSNINEEQKLIKNQNQRSYRLSGNNTKREYVFYPEGGDHFLHQNHYNEVADLNPSYMHHENGCCGEGCCDSCCENEEVGPEEIPIEYTHTHHLVHHHHHVIHGRCDPTPCLNSGTCTILAHGYECTCPVGYLGIHCETRSQCEPNPCRNGGTCYDVGGSFECVCQTGFKGLHCEEENKCHPSPCKNGGTCTETEEGFECSCKEGYKGKICEEINQCSPSPCKNGGTCAERNGKFECTCTIGFKGVTCEARSSCSSNPCLNGGTCNEENFGYSCSCRSGYKGQNCQDHVCHPLPCANGGTCYVKNGNAFCACADGFLGEKCQSASPCVAQPCLNGGTCYEYFNENVYQIPVFISTNNVMYHCHCPDGFSGKNCEDDECRFCDPHAICEKGKCICKEGYQGDGKVCVRKSLCHPNNPCLNGGTCKDYLGSYDCICPLGWTGEHCQDRKYCEPNPCKNGGTCIPLTGGFKCLCEGYKGKECEKPDPCQPNPCLHNGRCNDFNGSPTCECELRYSGDKCQVDNCERCHVNAQCINGHCECNTGFEGDGINMCQRVDERSKDPCINHQCQNGGTCVTDIITWGYKCVCPDGFGGRYCQDHLSGGRGDPCLNNPCLNGGTCVAVGETYQCVCNIGFKGPKCEEPSPGGGSQAVCHPNPCLNSGSCKENGNGFDCICDMQYTGSLCEVDKCAKCDPHAKCINGHCKCRNGWTGNGYECIKDDGCGGKCGFYAECETHVCQCQPGYVGNGYTCSAAPNHPSSCGICGTNQMCSPTTGTCVYI
nr:neurogenic locus notch homolog protein 2 isoform X1 [Hydra vulgaris]